MIDSELVKKIDSLIDGINIRNRSHAIETLLSETLIHNSPPRALIFAGGEKVRVGNKKMVKPLVPILGKPILSYLLAELKRNNITNVTIAIDKNSTEVRDIFKDGSQFGMRLSYARDLEPLGTEGALSNALKLMGDSPFFAVNGDCAFRMDIMEMYKQHLDTHALATVALTALTGPSYYHYENFGVTKLEGFAIVDFVEKPKELKGTELFSEGIYVIDPKVSRYVSLPAQRTMLEEHLFPLLAKEGKLYAFVHSGPWYSLDNDARLEISIAKFAKMILDNNMQALSETD